MNAHGIRRLAAVTLVAGALPLVLSSCGSGSHSSTTPITVFRVSADPGESIAPSDPRHPAVLTAAQLHVALDDALSAHADLVATLTDRVVTGDNAPTAAIAALAANTRALTDAIALVYGTDGARAFAQLWEQHTQFFVDYAHAARVHDGTAERVALRRLVDYQNDFASFVTTATAGGVPLVAVTGLLHGHVHDVTAFVDADAAGDHGAATRLRAAAVAHMHVIAGAIADAIVAQHLATVRS